MVALDQILASNARISTTLPSGLVGVFVGATKGIGLSTVLAFTKHVVKPRVYIVGRSVSAGEALVRQCKEINSGGDYVFLSKDISLMKNVDEVCDEIKRREKVINLLFCSQGTVKGWTETEEGLHFLVALTYYSKIRFAMNLLPIIQKAEGLKTVQFVFAATKEGPLDTSDFPAMRIGLSKGRGHMASMNTLGLELLRENVGGSKDVRFVHDFPGTVKTELLNHDVSGLGWKVLRGLVEVSDMLGRFMPFAEAGERQLWFATSGRFASGKGNGVSLLDGQDVCKGIDGEMGSGVYSIDHHGEWCGDKVRQLLKRFEEDGTRKALWEHTTEQFDRITGKEGT